MRSLMFVAAGQLRFDDVETPTLIEPGDALVRPLAATTCDLDHHVIADKTPFSGLGPFALGHECVGTVIEVGPACTKFAVGDIVGVAWHIACGTCIQCELGHPARCLRHGDAQYGLPANGSWGGTFSELIRVPYADYNLAPLPAGIDPVHLASIGDNLALGWETIMPTTAGITDPQIAVFGGTGSIGLYCVDVAVHCANARTVYYEARCVETRTAGSASGLGKRTDGNIGNRAPGRLNHTDFPGEAPHRSTADEMMPTRWRPSPGDTMVVSSADCHFISCPRLCAVVAGSGPDFHRVLTPECTAKRADHRGSARLRVKGSVSYAGAWAWACGPDRRRVGADGCQWPRRAVCWGRDSVVRESGETPDARPSRASTSSTPSTWARAWNRYFVDHGRLATIGSRLPQRVGGGADSGTSGAAPRKNRRTVSANTAVLDRGSAEMACARSGSVVASTAPNGRPGSLNSRRASLMAPPMVSLSRPSRITTNRSSGTPTSLRQVALLS
jgi:hypothetical protein